jgi:MbtH protein
MDGAKIMVRKESDETKTLTDECQNNVVVNEEGQYSIWPSHKEIPGGWFSIGFQGLKANCLAHIDAVWTDMRPKSARAAREASGDGQEHAQ